MSDTETCKFCKGTKKHLDGRSPCPSCEGRGFHEAMTGPFDHFGEDAAIDHFESIGGEALEGYDGDAL